MSFRDQGLSASMADFDPGGFQAHAEGFVRTLRGSGHAQSTIAMYWWVVVHLGRWLAVEGVSLAQLDDAVVQDFCTHLPSCQCPGRKAARQPLSPIVSRAYRFLAYLRMAGVVARGDVPPDQDGVPSVLREFEAWMLDHRGVKEVSIQNHRRPLCRLLKALGDDPGRYTARMLRQFMLQDLRAHGGQKPGRVTSALRMFLRWAAATGRCLAGLDEAVLTVPHRRLASLPQYLPPSDVECLIASCDTLTKVGIRDRAILLLLARLGLRPGDVALLQLYDIDWKEASLRLIGKGRREARLPLPQDVGDAILAYLEGVRPSSPSGHLFLRILAPFFCMTRHSVTVVVTRAMRRANIPLLPKGHGGARALRHSVATTMLRQGASLQDIGQLLRHRSFDTTAIYAKVDIERLRQVAQPWPEVLR